MHKYPLISIVNIDEDNLKIKDSLKMEDDSKNGVDLRNENALTLLQAAYLYRVYVRVT